MTLIITWILNLIKFLNKLLFRLECFLVDKYVSNTPSENPVSSKYRHFKVDAMPKIQVIEKLDYKKLLQDFFSLNGKELKPVKHRKNSKPVSPNIFCPRCSAPSIYLYDNTGGRGQLACKVCQTTFSKKNRWLNNIILNCPHCNKILDKIKERSNFLIYKCRNDNCKFYLKNLNALSKDEKILFKKSPHLFKVRYIYRLFDISIPSLAQSAKASLPYYSHAPSAMP